MLLDRFNTARQEGRKKLAVLIDPDKHSDLNDLKSYTEEILTEGCNYLFVGGSLLEKAGFEERLEVIKSVSNVPVIIFPGNEFQISDHADGILLLSLISGRNPDLLIGKHVHAAPFLKASSLEILPTGYMLVDGGRQTTASYISGTSPLPADKPGIAACTAMAGEMLGLQLLYLDAGSGAQFRVSDEMIRAVRNQTSAPLITGGGIRSEEDAIAAWSAGADIVVVGSVAEKDPSAIGKIFAHSKELDHINPGNHSPERSGS